MNNQDVIIIGGGISGLSAALFLARALHPITVIDSGHPRNAAVDHAHALITRDGVNPLELLKIARTELSHYPHANFLADTVMSIERFESVFKVTTKLQKTITAKKILLATGLVDTLPAIIGIDIFWAKNLFLCEYCDGYEVKDQPLAVYDTTDYAYLHVLHTAHWSRDICLLTDGYNVLDEKQKNHLSQLSIKIYPEKILSSSGTPGKEIVLHFANNEMLSRRAVFLHTIVNQHANFAQQLGCEFTEEGSIKVDSAQKTTQAGIYAVGDATTKLRLLSVASAHGAVAGVMLDKELIGDELGVKMT